MARLVYSVVRLSYMAQSIYQALLGAPDVPLNASASVIGQSTTLGSIPYIVKRGDSDLLTLYRACIRAAVTLYAFLFTPGEDAFKQLKREGRTPYVCALDEKEMHDWLLVACGLDDASVARLSAFHKKALRFRHGVVHHMAVFFERFVCYRSLSGQHKVAVDVEVRKRCCCCGIRDVVLVFADSWRHTRGGVPADKL
jgi:hypothetical protein